MSPTIAGTMPTKSRPGSAFGERLLALRKTRGFTQVELAKAISSTQRALSYYENDAEYPPAPVIVALASALRVSTDELLGVKAGKIHAAPPLREETRLEKKFRQLRRLPEKDQRALIRVINSLVKTKTGSG